jgi:hypothetical protein
MIPLRILLLLFLLIMMLMFSQLVIKTRKND